MIESLTLTEVVCCNCLTHFAMDIELQRRCRESERTFYCPNGHPQVYTETEVQKLKKQLQSANNRAHCAEYDARNYSEQLQAEKKEKANIKRQLTITRKRIANGVCPCCHRTFVQLQRHMSSKHPQFKEAVS